MTVEITLKGTGKVVRTDPLFILIAKRMLAKGICRGKIKMVLMAQGRYKVAEAQTIIETAEAVSL